MEKFLPKYEHVLEDYPGAFSAKKSFEMIPAELYVPLHVLSDAFSVMIPDQRFINQLGEHNIIRTFKPGKEKEVQYLAIHAPRIYLGTQYGEAYRKRWEKTFFPYSEIGSYILGITRFYGENFFIESQGQQIISTLVSELSKMGVELTQKSTKK